MAWSIADSEVAPDAPITSSLATRWRNGGIESGAKALFHQASAPLAWTKLTDLDNRAIRVFSGTPSDAGSVNFSTVFARSATDGHVLTEAQMPQHSHTYTRYASEYSHDAGNGANFDFTWRSTSTRTTSNAGSNQSHAHDIDLRVKYCGVIRCQKD